jgi:hypothetical protein
MILVIATSTMLQEVSASIRFLSREIQRLARMMLTVPLGIVVQEVGTVRPWRVPVWLRFSVSH